MLMEVAPIKSSGSLKKQREHENRRTDWDKEGVYMEWGGDEGIIGSKCDQNIYKYEIMKK